MKNILISLLVVGAVTGTVWGASSAFFSDTETSPANNLTAGKVDLTIDSTAHYDGMICEGGQWQPDGSVEVLPRPELVGLACTGSWPAGDLTSEKFWDLIDVKPGDYGENTISMHVEDNPVWACIDIFNLNNAENDRIDPEVEALDLTDDPQGGELAQNIHFTAWADDGDNIWEQGEPLLFTNEQGPASDVLNGKTYTLVDSASLLPTPFPGGSTQNLGLAWCAGTMTIDGINFTITCDGASMGNESQTDSLTADVRFRVEQHRNNPDFLCNPVVQ